MERITAFEGIRDATYYRERVYEEGQEVAGQYFRYTSMHGILQTETDNPFVQCGNAARDIAEEAYYCDTVDQFNDLIDRLEKVKVPLLEYMRKRLREEGILPQKKADHEQKL